MLTPDGAYVELLHDNIITDLDEWGTRDNFITISTDAALEFELRST